MDQMSMFTRCEWQEFDLPDGRVRLLPGFMNTPSAWSMLERLTADIPWRQDTIRMFGKTHNVPRLQQWFGDDGLTYTWSGIEMDPAPWPSSLLEVRAEVEKQAETQFNSVLANLYRDGDDVVGWHADDEPELGPDPVIASVSLGAERDFVLRHNRRNDVPNVTITLPHGSLLVMSDGTQRNWQHTLPRRKRIDTPRLNLTFRYRYH